MCSNRSLCGCIVYMCFAVCVCVVMLRGPAACGAPPQQHRTRIQIARARVARTHIHRNERIQVYTYGIFKRSPFGQLLCHRQTFEQILKEHRNTVVGAHESMPHVVTSIRPERTREKRQTSLSDNRKMISRPIAGVSTHIQKLLHYYYYWWW